MKSRSKSGLSKFSEIEIKCLNQKPIVAPVDIRRTEIKESYNEFERLGKTFDLNKFGIKYVKSASGVCFDYVMGDGELNKIVPGILDHNGKPEEGDIVAYTHDISKPKHFGIYRGEKMVESKWGQGPVFLHGLKDVLPQYGNFVLFSTYNVFEKSQSK